MEELIKYLSEKLDVDASAISPTSHVIGRFHFLPTSMITSKLVQSLKLVKNSIVLLLTKKLMALKQYKISLISLVTNVSS